MPEIGPDSLAETFRGDRGMQRLLDALALGEGFRFHILVCETPFTAQAAVRFLEEETGGPVVRIQPKWDVSRALTFQEIVSTVLEPLVAVGESEAESPKFVVLDASDAAERDEPAWRNTFRIMNERRNGITRQVPCALILCLPPRLEVVFAREAPDFWSVRSTTSQLTALGVAAEGPAIKLGQPELMREERTVLWERDPERLRQEVEAARKHVEEAPDSPSALRSLSIWLDRLGQYEQERGTLARALAAFEEALEVDRRLAVQDQEWLRNLSISLRKVGNVHRDRGSLDRALSSYEESLGLVRRLLEQDPDRPEWLRDLSMSLEQIGNVHRDRGSLDRALSSYEESLGLTRRLLEQAPDQPEWLRDLSVSLEKIGNVHIARGSLDRALSSYEESLGLMRRLLEQDPDQPEWLRDLSVSLEKVGNVHRARGSLDRALSSYEESLGLMRRLLEQDPDRPEWLRDLSVSLEKIGDVHDARGSLDRALASYEESLGLRRRLLEQDLDRPEWRWDLALSIWRVGKVLQSQGHLEKALAALEEGQQIVSRLMEEFPEVPAHLQEWPEILDQDVEEVRAALAQAS